MSNPKTPILFLNRQIKPALLLICLFHTLFTNAQIYQTEYSVQQNINSEFNFELKYTGIAVISNSAYLYLQKNNYALQAEEIRKRSDNGSMMIFHTNPDTLPKIVYRHFDSSIIRIKISNSPDDIQYYVQEQIGNKYKTKILNEFKNIQGFNCQRALFLQPGDNETPIAAAWFCPEVEISSGPSGLNGLPGLVIEAEHFQTNERFSLIRFNETAPDAVISFWPEQFNNVGFIWLNRVSALDNE